jgi:uncharacterized protein (DUF885 family)
MKRLTLVVIAAVALALGCAKGASTGRAAAEENPDFVKLVDDYFEWSFRTRPSSATLNGVHRWDGELEDLSREAIEARIDEMHGFLGRLEAIDPAELSFDEQIDAEMIASQIRGTLLDMETLRIWETNPMLYVWIPGGAIDGLIKREFAPAAERLTAVTSRLEKVPAVFEAGRVNVLSPPRELTDLAIRMARGSVWYLENTVADWAKEAADGDEGALAAFEDANADAIAAARSFAAWLEKDLLPRSNAVFAIGEENFTRKLLYDEMVDMPLAELLAIGEAQLDKDYRAFVETAKLIDPAKSAAEVMRSLSDEHPTAEDLIPSVQRTVEQARQFLIDRDIVTVPSEVRAIVRETPPYARAGSFASMDTPGPYETKATEAYYYVTPVEDEWDAKRREEHLRLYNPYVVAMINVHEAYPGHYLQFLYAPQFRTKTRKLLWVGTNVEGWAHYTEQMMVDEGFGGGDPKYRLAQLQEALLRDCRFVAGIKMHTEGWTVERAAKELFEARGFQEPANAYEEARRGVYDPTYLYYTLGKIEVQKLRDDYMQKKGASLKEFHDAFVAEGGLPIPLVRKILLP